MSSAEAFRAAFVADLEEFNADLAAGAKMYADPAQHGWAIVLQLQAVLDFLEPWVKPGTLFPLSDHLYELAEQQRSRHGRGSDPVETAEMMRRALALALTELEFEARRRRDLEGAAKVAAAAYPPYTHDQIIRWRKSANSGRDPILRAACGHWVAHWRREHPGEPGKAAAGLKTIADEAKKFLGPRSR